MEQDKRNFNQQLDNVYGAQMGMRGGMQGYGGGPQMNGPYGGRQPYGNNNSPYGNNGPYGGNDYNPNQGPALDGDLDNHFESKLHDDDDGSLSKPLSSNSRNGFIAKVYSILSFQLVTTAIICAIVYLNEDVQHWLYKNPWLIILASFLSIIIMYALGCYPAVARSVPINYILLLIFTLAESLVVACMCARYDPGTVLIAAAITAAVVVGLSLYACFTKTDITMCGGVLFAGAMILCVGSIVGIFVKNHWFQLVLTGFAGLLFAVYLVYDTQLIMGKHSRSLSVDDYIWAAMMLYIDIVRIFMVILKLVGQSE